MYFFPFKKLILAFLALLVFSAYAAAEEPGAKVTDIQISGNRKVESETIRSKLTIKVGDNFSPSAVRADISTVYKMGYFSDIRVVAEGYEGGIRLIFNVVERPIISAFTFEGNKKLDAAKLREQVNLSAYSIYNPSLVDENAEKLRLFYQNEGYFNAKVMPIIKVQPKDVKVIFLIDEGARVIIKKIEFIGNDKISSKKILKAMATKKYIPLWSYIMKTGTYKIVEFSQDIDRIKGLYYNNGYLQVSVGEPKVDIDQARKYLTITVPIHEGNQFRYRNLDMSGNKIFTKEELFKNMKSKAGDIMNRDLLKEDVVAMSDRYGTKGYAFATISPVVNPDPDKKLVDVTLEVNEGDQIFVNRINIQGNVKTRDKVIRREIKFSEGDIYDTSSLKLTYERLKRLDFFEDVEIVPDRKGNSDVVDLNVKVKEKSTGSFSIGGGYSTVDRLVAIGEVTQNNFLGRGDLAKFKGEFGSRTQNYTLSFMEPWLLDRPISLRVDATKEQRAYNGYTEKSAGGTVSLGKRFMDYYGVTGSYSWMDTKYSAIVTSISEDPHYYQSENLHTTGKVGLNLYRDSRDSLVDPRRGNNNSVYGEYASTVLGGTNAFYKVIADSTWYFPFYWETAFSLHGRIGYSEGADGRYVPLYERFYVGGIDTVRGFNWGAIGPKAQIPVRNTSGQVRDFYPGDPVGGNKELIFNSEYTFPLIPSIKLRGVAFFDAGDAYNDRETMDLGRLRYSSGAGVRWISPMGLIRLEYGIDIFRKPGEDIGKFEFSMGSMF
ncbi:MAG: outer membrane protein assembly factor BamA [Nitrospirota bacterium]